MRRMIIILSILLGIGLTAEAQSVRSTTRRGYNAGTRVHQPANRAYGFHGSYHGVHHGRYGYGSVRVGVHVGSYGYSGSGYWNPYPRVRVGCGTYPVHPGYVYRQPRARVVYVDPVPIEQLVPVEVPVRSEEIRIQLGKDNVITLRPGDAVITPDGVILENRDGELVVHRGEQ